jgi:antitoxin (DNA-binding transcriptional repressor) of toxin-antitoxin stability system
MRVVGIRELRASLSATLKDVSRGEHVRVTLRGRVLADIVPAGSAVADDRLSALIAEGRVTPPGGPRPARPPRLARTQKSASALVLAERDAER